MKKYIRTVFFDVINKKWNSFYVNKKGKIIIDKVSKYVKDIKKNLKGDRYKKVTKKESFGYQTVLNERKIQDKIDRIIRKKKLSDIDQQILNNYDASYNYRNIDIRKKLNKPQQQYEKDTTLIYFFDAIICKITNSYFQIYSKQFKLFRELFLKRDLNRFKKFLITMELMSMEIQGITGKKFYSSLKNFSSVMAEIIGDNFFMEEIDWLQEKIKITFKGIR